MNALPSTAARLRLRSPVVADTRRAAGTLALAGIVGSGFVLAAGVAAEPSSFVPGRKGGFPGWLHQPFSSLDLGLAPSGIVLAMLAMWAFYGLALAFSDTISPRRALGAIVALHVIFLLAPPLLSTDVFSYISYGRLGLLHGLNPYTHSPDAVPADAAFGFIGWRDATSVYGPAFTLGTYATAPLGVGGALWAMKAVTAGASLGCVALVWKAAERLGRRPHEAAMFFGLNPLLLVNAVGGAHNDVLMLAGALGGIVLVLGGRERAGGLAVVGAAAVKASSAMLLPYLFIGARRRGRLITGALAGAAAAAALWTIAFHAEVGPFLETLRWEQQHGSLHSVPKAVDSLLGAPVSNHWASLTWQLLLAGAVAATLWRAHRGRDWLVAAGWGTFALLVTTAWLLPWYVIWLLPIAAMTGDRKLRIATLALSAFVIGMRIPLWLG
jgi:glycosyl transferase family 87